MGRVGQAVARLLRAFGTEGLYFDPVAVLTDEAAAALGLRRVSPDELLAEADVVTLHVPLTPRTDHLIDASTRDAPGAKMRAPMANLVRFYDGKPLENPVALDSEAPA